MGVRPSCTLRTASLTRLPSRSSFCNNSYGSSWVSGCGLRLPFFRQVESQVLVSQHILPGTLYGDALDDFRDRWLHGIAFMVLADNLRFSLISSTKPSTSLELILNSGPRPDGALFVIARISADGIAGMYDSGTVFTMAGRSHNKNKIHKQHNNCEPTHSITPPNRLKGAAIDNQPR